MTLAGSLKGLAAKLARATSSVHDDIARLRAAIAETRRQLQHAQDAPLSREDAHARIVQHVREAGARWLAEWGKIFVYSERGLFTASDRGAQLPWANNQAPPWGAVCAADPAGAEAFLRGLVDRVEYSPGPAVAERPALVEKLTAELAALEAEEEAAVDACNLAGVTVEHRPGVVQRREAEKRARELQEQGVADRRRRQAALDEAHDSLRPRSRLVSLPNPDPATGGARSAYIEQGRHDVPETFK